MSRWRSVPRQPALSEAAPTSARSPTSTRPSPPPQLHNVRQSRPDHRRSRNRQHPGPHNPPQEGTPACAPLALLHPGNANLPIAVLLPQRQAPSSWHSLQAVRRDCCRGSIGREFVNPAAARFIPRTGRADSKGCAPACPGVNNLANLLFPQNGNVRAPSILLISLSYL
jgi:hypothetical protein